VKDVAKVEIGYAPRLGQFGYMKQDEAVEGVILMRVGEQAQVILRRVEAMTKELNERVLPPDVKVVPYYDRQGLIEKPPRRWKTNLLRGMLLVLVILGLFLFSVRTALIVAITIPLPLMFSFICLDWRHIPANLLSIGAIDFGIIVDGAVVMVENIFRELSARPWQRVLRRGGCHPRRRARCGAAHLLCHRRDHRGLSSHLRPHRAFGTAVFNPWRIPCRFALLGSLFVRADAVARAVLLFPGQAHSRTPHGAV